MKLTKEQSKLVEDNMGLAFKIAIKFAKENYRSVYGRYMTVEDVKQIGLESLCKQSKRYDKSKGSFSSFVYRSLELDISRGVREFNSVKIPQLGTWDYSIHKANISEIEGISTSGIGSLDIAVSSDNNDSPKVVDTLCNNDDSLRYEFIVKEMMNELTRKEKEILKYVLDGYKQREIAEMYGVEKGTVWRYMREIKKKTRSILN